MTLACDNRQASYLVTVPPPPNHTSLHSKPQTNVEMYGHQSVNLTKALHDSPQLYGTVKDGWADSYLHESLSDRQNSQPTVKQITVSGSNIHSSNQTKFFFPSAVNSPKHKQVTAFGQDVKPGSVNSLLIQILWQSFHVPA